MCPNSTRVKISKKSAIDNALQFTPPEYKENEAGAYIQFYAFDPERGKLRRKTIKINRIKGANNRKKYARGVIARLNEQLSRGWNPWIIADTSNLHTIVESLNRYDDYINKMFENSLYRKETYVGYKSYLKILREYIDKHSNCYYTYQFDKQFCVDFLDYIFIERNNGAQTRNNYLNFLRVLSGFFLEKGFITTKPTDGIKPISKRLFKKERTRIPAKVVKEIAKYLKEYDPRFLFVCYLLYYCFIRPVEITRLRVRDFNLKKCTLTVQGECSKNKETQTVTVPKKVIMFGIEQGFFSAPMDDFIVSEKLRPGTIEIDPKIFRDHWATVRKALRLKPEWKFYSLKDTGITELLEANMPSIEVRDQARHSSLSITEIYAQRSTKVNEEILDLDGAL